MEKGQCITNIQFVSSNGLTPRLSSNWQQYFNINYNIGTTAQQIAVNPAYSSANTSPVAPVALTNGYAW